MEKTLILLLGISTLISVVHVLRYGNSGVDLVKEALHCKHGGSFDVKYVGSGRVILAPEGAFTTQTSKECCGLCDAIKGIFVLHTLNFVC